MEALHALLNDLDYQHLVLTSPATLVMQIEINVLPMT